MGKCWNSVIINMKKVICMMEFIKKNKMFVAVLTFIFVVMAAVAVYALSINKPSDIAQSGR